MDFMLVLTVIKLKRLASMGSRYSNCNVLCLQLSEVHISVNSILFSVFGVKQYCGDKRERERERERESVCMCRTEGVYRSLQSVDTCGLFLQELKTLKPSAMTFCCQQQSF